MPLFEYSCKSCDHRFESLVRGSETPTCPSCHSTTLERRQSVFAVRTDGASSESATLPMGPCGTCGDPRGPGSCAVN